MKVVNTNVTDNRVDKLHVKCINMFAYFFFYMINGEGKHSEEAKIPNIGI